MILQIKDKDSPIREINLEQAKFEYQNKIISNSALYWKEGMQQWEPLDQMPEIKEINSKSPNEKRLGENWLYRQISARRSYIRSDSPLNIFAFFVNILKIFNRHLGNLFRRFGILVAYVFPILYFMSNYSNNRIRDGHEIVVFFITTFLAIPIVRRKIWKGYRSVAIKSNMLILRIIGSFIYSLIKLIIIYTLLTIIIGIFYGKHASTIGGVFGLCIGMILIGMVFSVDIPFRVRKLLPTNLEKNSKSDVYWKLLGFIFFIFLIAPIVSIFLRLAATLPVFIDKQEKFINKQKEIREYYTGKVVGNKLNYSIQIPNGCKVLPNNRDGVDMSILSDKNFALEIVCYEESLEDNESFYKLCSESYDAMANAITISETPPEKIIVDGEEWLQIFKIKKINNKNYGVLDRVTTGNHGTYAFSAQTTVDPYDKTLSNAIPIMDSFKFPKGI